MLIVCVTCFACEQKRFEALELPFDATKVTRVVAIGARGDDVDDVTFVRWDVDYRAELANHDRLLTPRELAPADVTKLYRTLTRVFSQSPDASVPLCGPPRPRDFIDFLTADGTVVASLSVCFTCRVSYLEGTAFKRVVFIPDYTETIRLAELFASAGFPEFLPEEYWMHTTLAAASNH